MQAPVDWAELWPTLGEACTQQCAQWVSSRHGEPGPAGRHRAQGTQHLRVPGPLFVPVFSYHRRPGQFLATWGCLLPREGDPMRKHPSSGQDVPVRAPPPSSFTVSSRI